MRALVRANREVSYAEITSEYGHDAFLMPIPLYHDMLRSYLSRVAREVNGPEEALSYEASPLPHAIEVHAHAA